jgi:type II secretory pathway pseudopilin PulG
MSPAMPRRGALLILVAGICAMLAALAAALAARTMSMQAEARTVEAQAQARICLNAALAYLLDDLNTTGRVQTANVLADYRPAVRVPLVNQNPALYRSGWFRIRYEASSAETLVSIAAWRKPGTASAAPTVSVPLWHDFIVTVGGGASRGLKPGEVDGAPASLSSWSASELELARGDEPRLWFRVRVMPPIWHQGEPFVDSNANGAWDAGEPYWQIYDTGLPRVAYQAGWPFSDLNRNRTATPDAGEPFFVANGTGTRFSAAEATWTTADDANLNGAPDLGEGGWMSDSLTNGPYANNGRCDIGRWYLYDTREAWDDANGNGVYDGGETFLPYDSPVGGVLNGVYDADLPNPFRGWGVPKIEPLLPRGDGQDW